MSTRNVRRTMLALLLFALAQCGGKHLAPTLDPSVAETTVHVTGRAAIRDDAASKAQAWVAAERAARIDGYRRLAEQIFGLHLSSEGTVRMATLEKDEIRTRVEAYVRNAIVGEPRHNEDLGIVEIDMTLSMGRAFQEAVFGR